jgi:hypothetical protein
MKLTESETNRLCLACRRTCKQPKYAVVAACPRFYQGPRIKRGNWKQLELPWGGKKS